MADEQKAEGERMTIAVANGLLLGHNPSEASRWLRRRNQPAAHPVQSPEEFRGTIARLAATGRIRIHD